LSDARRRRPWTEGPDEDAPAESWLVLGDDALLHRIGTLVDGHEEDERLLEVVASDRHFFIRQEAAKRVTDRERLFAYEDDRHIGQILVRHLTRREDVTYLRRLCDRSTYKEVRAAAQVQLARLWHRLDARAEAGAQAEPAPERAQAPADAGPPAPAPASTSAPDAPSLKGPAQRETAAAPQNAAAPESAAPSLTSAALEKGWVDGSLLAWAVHFLVEPAWTHLGTKSTRELLMQTRRELLGRYPTLVSFEITLDAHVATNLDAGLRLPADTVRAVAAWMLAFRAAVVRVTPGFEPGSVRAATAMMADALRDTGFYAACDELEASARV
jgi:hypothetical protein